MQAVITAINRYSHTILLVFMALDSCSLALTDIQEGVLRSLSGLLDRPACLAVFEANRDAVGHLVPLLLKAFRGLDSDMWQGLVEVLLRWG